jgi:serine/threonine protein kinase
MEEVEPISQVSEALRIIEDVTKTSSKFLMNKRQCESLSHRLVYPIGETLKELPKEFACSQSLDVAGNKMDYPAFDLLLTVLKKAQALLAKYTEPKDSIPSVLTRTEDREAFQEIHAELDLLKSQFLFDDGSETQRIAMLTGDADEDRHNLSETLHEAAVLPTNLEKMKLVVSEKSSEGTSSDGLPSFLAIDPTSVEIKGEVRVPERLSEFDPVESDDWARVRFGNYLGCEFALKVFKSGNRTWNRSELLKEVRSLMELHHPHIVQLMGFAQDEEKCIILMELMDTDLRHLMKQRSGNRPFSRAVEMDLITQIARGMYYLHEQQYVHGELKCSNILVKQTGDHVDLKISDLRSSQKLGAWDPVVFKERSERRRARWTAPELARYGEAVHPTDDLLKKSDVYSFGMVCYEVITGKLPFQDVRGRELESRIENGDVKQELPGELDEKLRGLIESCWSLDPCDRPTFETICHLLDDIRSSQPPVAVLSFGIGTVLGHLKMIPLILGHFRGAERNMAVTTSWGPTSVGDGVQQDSVEVLILPEFVRIEPAQLKKRRLIGRGAYAEVYEATWLGCKYAVKTFKSISPSEVQRELKFLIEFRHPSIVRLMGLSVHSERRCSIVMEFMGGDLRERIESCMRKRKVGRDDVVPFDVCDGVYIIRRIALGMAFLHSRGVIHRDLKALNVLVPEQSGSIDVKITDFGVSHLIDSSERPTVVAGTGFWRAPEMFQTGAYDLKATDVYSFAMTCYEVLTGRVPLADQEKVYGGPAAVRLAVSGEGLRPTLPSDLNPDLKLLIEDCWDGKPERRPTFSTICQKLQTIQQGLLC